MNELLAIVPPTQRRPKYHPGTPSQKQYPMQTLCVNALPQTGELTTRDVAERTNLDLVAARANLRRAEKRGLVRGRRTFEPSAYRRDRTNTPSIITYWSRVHE